MKNYLFLKFMPTMGPFWSKSYCSGPDWLLQRLQHSQTWQPFIYPYAIYGIHQIREWFSSYLRGRQQSVHANDKITSTWWNVIKLMWPCFWHLTRLHLISSPIFDVYQFHYSPSLVHHLYADDLQICSQTGFDNFVKAIDRMKNNFGTIRDWSERFGLSGNSFKCHSIIAGTPWMIFIINM